MEEILSSSMELNVEPKVEESKIDTQPEPAETIEALEELSTKAEENVPLKKYMSEKNARRDAESRAKELESELTALRNSPKGEQEVKLDVRALSEKHNIDEEALRDILNASYSMTKDKVKAELEAELNPKLAEFEGMKREKEVQKFEQKFQTILSETLKEMPEYKDLVDQDDLKQWIRSGQYSKLSIPQLIEQKYGKFVTGKKTIENSYVPNREQEVPDTLNMKDEDYARLETDPAFKKKWAEDLPNRLRKYM